MSERRTSGTTEECARSFMLRSRHLESLQHLVGPRYLGIPAFRLPAKPEECCDLCLELERLAVRAIGPDLRYESTRILFFSHRKHLVLKLHLPEEDAESPVYFSERCFDIYSHPGVPCPWHLFKPYRFLNLKWAFDKLHKCETAHDCCGKDPTPLPTRVIKIGRRPHDIRLQKGGLLAPYICLSHCWGSKQPLITNKQNVDDHFGCIVWEDLPLLYQDTIRLAWQLDIEYVWIDSLCIVQNSPDDWAREAGRMQYVYGNSWLTIAATANPDCCSGILDRSCDEEASARFALSKDCIEWSGVTRQNTAFSWLAVPRDIDTCKDDKHEKDNCRWPLLTRGWVLQERLLSRRVLYFAAANLLWSCRKAEEIEGDRPRPAHMGMGINGIDACLNLPSWKDIIEAYSRLKLTNQHDRLPALSGLTQRLSRGMPDGVKYLAGLWSSGLIQELPWHNAQEASVGSLTECSRQLCQGHEGTPSWSWAAINSPVIFPNSVPLWGTEYHAKISEAECTPISHHDPTGRVSSGRIHVRGPISPVRQSDQSAINDQSTIIHFDCPAHMDFNYLVDNEIKCLVLYKTKPDRMNRGEIFNRAVGLLLQPVTGTDSKYHRVGVIYTRDGHDQVRVPPAWYERLSNVGDIIIV